MPEPDAHLIITAHRQGPLLAASIRTGLDAVGHARRRDRTLELLVVLAGQHTATAEVAAEQLQGRGTLMRLPGGGLGEARNMGIVQATGPVIGILEGGDLVDPEWLLRAMEAVTKELSAVVRAQYLLLFGPTFGVDDFLLRQSGMEKPDFARHRLIFERLMFGPMVLSRAMATQHPFDPDMDEHMFGPDDWAWTRRTARAGAKHLALEQSIAAVHRRPAGDPLSPGMELKAGPAERFS